MSVSVNSTIVVKVKGSSLVQKIAYSQEDRQLSVELNGAKVYQYSDVPETEAQRFMQAKSHGTYFLENIKDAYDCSAL